ncbi:MAG TPA: EboA domain-containing protein [Gammaproteobacteria bacterium]|nr:EboA domain-containing protein [Gammaproteobacteria bacterium]
MQERIAEGLEALLDGDGSCWLAAARAEIMRTEEPRRVLERLFPTVARALGRRDVPDEARIEIDGEAHALRGWQTCDVGRALLLLAGSTRLPPAELAAKLYRAGDESERAAIVRSLSLLPEGATLKPVALDAGRVNSVTLFGALALDNPYPAAHYSEHEFNQLVLKTLFMGLPLGAVVGLERRANAELARMCGDFYDERTAAGRNAPVDIWLALVPFAPADRLELAKQHLVHADPAHRFHAALALGRRGARHPELRALLGERVKHETDARVLTALRHRYVASEAAGAAPDLNGAARL